MHVCAWCDLLSTRHLAWSLGGCLLHNRVHLFVVTTCAHERVCFRTTYHTPRTDPVLAFATPPKHYIGPGEGQNRDTLWLRRNSSGGDPARTES
jgi:hypothetical protein